MSIYTGFAGFNKISRRRLLSAVVAGAALIFAGADRADAGPMLLQLEQGGDVLNVTGTTDEVNVLNARVGDYEISLVGGTSNTPGDDFNAILNITTLTVTRFAQTSTESLFIRLLADDFLKPEGNPLFLGSSASATFTGESAGSTVEFTSFFNTANSSSFASGVATAPVTIVSGDELTEGEGSRAPTKTVARLNPAFSLSNITEINLLTLNSTVNTTGSTEVRSEPFGLVPGAVVPEPTSLALLAFGGLGLMGAGLRKRRNAGPQDC